MIAIVRCYLGQALAGVASVLLMMIGALDAQATAIYWASDPVRPGETVLIIGDDFGSAPRVLVYEMSIAGESGKAAYQVESHELRLKDTQQIAFKLPPALTDGAYVVEITGVGPPARTSLNTPKIYWTQSDAGVTILPGGQLHIFGRNIQWPGKSSKLRMRSLLDEVVVTLDAERADSWEAVFRVPWGLAPGNYGLDFTSGAGGWVTAGTTSIEARKSSPSRRFDVKQFGALGDGQADDSVAVQRALADAGQGGGIVFLPRGRYRLTSSLFVPRDVVLAGEGAERSALTFNDFQVAPHALIAGVSHFGVRDLAIYASNHRHVIAANTDPAEGPRGHVTIERIRVRAMQLRGHVKPAEIEEKYRLSSLRFTETDTIRLGGDANRIIESDFYGSGRSLALYDPRGAVVIRNRFHNGRLGWYSITGADGVLFESNEVVGSDLMSTGGSLNVLEGRAFSRNVIFRGNSFKQMHGWDREAITTDGGGGYYYGPVHAVSAKELRLTTAINGPWAARVTDWRGAGVFVLGGRGRGQWARVESIQDGVITLDRALQTLPDETTLVTITQMQENYLFIDNRFEDVGSAIQYYGTSLNHIAAGNHATRSSGFLASGRWYRHYQPTWYCQFIDNEIHDGNVYRGGPNAAFWSDEARLGVWGLQKPPNTAPLALGIILRRNRLTDNAFIEIKGENSDQTPGVADIIVENNIVERSSNGIRYDAGVRGLVIEGNIVK